MDDMIRVHNWQIDLDNRIRPSIDSFKMKQGDQNTNEISLTVFNKGLPVDLIGKTVVFLFLKPNGTKVEHSSIDLENPLIVNDNKVSCMIKNNVLTDSGEITVEITIMEYDQLLTTQKVIIHVISSIDWLRDHEEDVQVPILQSLISDVQQLKEDNTKLTFKTWNELVNGKGA